MGVVKYTGPMASFHCPTNAEIRHLKVHFSPKQEGTGDPSPENVRPIVGWEEVAVHDCSKPYASTTTIPGEYTRVEYLEGTGTQCIRTDLFLLQSVDTIYDVVIGHWTIGKRQLNGADYGAYFGLNANGRYEIGTNSIIDGSTNGYDIINFKQDIAKSRQILTVNGNTFIRSNYNAWRETRILIFDIASSSDAYRCTCRIKKFTITRNKTIIGDFVPCVRKSDNKPGMYDTVSQTFYTNAGTGEFLYGPEINGFDAIYQFGALGKNKLSDRIEDYENNVGSPSVKEVPNDFKFENGEYSGTVALTRDFCVHVGKTKFEPGTYTISFDYINGGQNYYWQPVIFSINNTSSWYSAIQNDCICVASNDSGHIERTFTATQPFYISLSLNTHGNATQAETNKIYNLQLELGSTATAYEPYNPNKTVYGGWVDLITGEVQEEWNSINVPDTTDKILGSTGGFANNTQYQGDTFTHRYFVISKRSITSVDLFSNKLMRGSPYNAAWKWSYDGTGLLHFSVDNDAIGVTSETSAADRNVAVATWLQENPIHMVYKLATPLTYQLHLTELSTFFGQNNVWSNADYVEVEYDLHETQTILQRKQYILANQPHIVTAQDKLVNFRTDLAAPLKSCKVYFTPVQEGTGDPSPDNVRAISGWDGVNITHSGKNMCVIPTTNMSRNGLDLTINSEEGTITVNGIASAQTDKYEFGSFDFTKGNFILSGCPNGGSNTTYGMGLIGMGTGDYGSGWIVPTNYGVRNPYIRIWKDAVCNNVIFKPMIRVSTDDDTFEPYQGTTIPLDWSDSTGTIYGGYVDLVNREVVNCWRYITLSSDYNVYVSGSSYRGTTCTDAWFDIQSIGYTTSYVQNQTSDDIQCDKFALVSKCIWGDPDTYPWKCVLNSYNQLHCVFVNDVVGITSEDSNTVAIAKIKTWIDENPINVAYRVSGNLITHHPLSTTALKTLRGINNIQSDTNGNIKVSYWTH